MDPFDAPPAAMPPADNFDAMPAADSGMAGYSDVGGGDMGGDGFAGGDMGYSGGDGFAAPGGEAQDDYQMDPMSSMPEPEDVNSALQEFNTKWDSDLLLKDEEEKQTSANNITKARDDLESFERERLALRESKMQKNRSEEQLLLEQIEADLESDNPWTRVLNLVDLTAEGTAEADMARMRQMLIQLKNEPVVSGH